MGHPIHAYGAGAAASGLFGAACTSARSCMAVGGTSSPNDIGGFLAERWNGTRWSFLPAPALPPGQLSGVSCTQVRDDPGLP